MKFEVTITEIYKVKIDIPEPHGLGGEDLYDKAMEDAESQIQTVMGDGTEFIGNSVTIKEVQ